MTRIQGRAMQFVVKAAGGLLEESHWLSTRWPDGSRDFVPRELAASFQTAEQARDAIADVGTLFKEAGIVFSIEQVID